MPMTPIDEFFQKITWEGGYLHALDYGLSPGDYDIPGDMQHEWQIIRLQFEELRYLYDNFEEKWMPDG